MTRPLAIRHYANPFLALLTCGFTASAFIPTQLRASISEKETPKPAIKSGKGVIVTFSDVAPILNRSCVPCHRKGEVAPFTLGTYAEAKRWAPMMAASVARGAMPPWKAAPGYGVFHDDRSLSEKDKATLAAWVEAGTPAGDLSKAPTLPTFTPGAWPSGNPDFVATPAAPYSVRADGTDEYRCFVLPTTFTHDAYVKLSQVKPGNPRVVHHVILYADPTGTRALEADAADAREGFENPHAGAGPPVDGARPVAAWVPGSRPRPLPANVAAKIPKGSRLILEVHYHPSGKPETDQTSVGLTFTQETVDKVMSGYGVAQPFLDLPAGESHIPVKSRVTIREDVTALAVGPHMHLTGKEMHVWAEKPDKTKIELIWVKNWDFNWQDAYWFKDPVVLPKGTTVYMEAQFDNSATNPRNPHSPPKRLHWGESSTDEMCLAALVVTRDTEKLGVTPVRWREAVKE